MSADIIALLRADTSDFTAKMAEAKGEVGDLSKSGSSNFAKLSTVGKAALLGIGAAAIGVAAVSVDLAEKYQATTTQIAANAGISVAAAGKITRAFLDTAGSTIYSGQQIATAYAGVAGELGATQGKALNAGQAMSVMRAAMNLAEGSGTGLTAATQALGATMQAYQIKAKGAAGASNVLFDAARLTGQGVDATSAALDKVRTRLGAVSPPLGQVGALLVDMTEHGETGRAALTGLSTAFTSLLKPATDVATAQLNLKVATDALPPSLQSLAAGVKNGSVSYNAATTAAEGMGSAQEALFSKFLSANSAVQTAGQAAQKMGVSFTTASGQVRPMSQIIAQFHAQLAGLTPAQATAKLSAEGLGSSAAKLAGVFLAGAPAYDKATASVDKSGAAADAAAKQQQTLQHQIETLKAAAQDYATKLGLALIPKIEAAARVTAKIVEWFGKNKAVAMILAGVVGGALVAAMGAYVGAQAKAFGEGALKGVMSLVNGFKMLTGAEMEADEAADANPIGLIVLAAAALAVAAVEVVKHWKSISKFFTKLWKDVRKIFDDAVHDILGFIKSYWPEIVGVFLGPIALIVALCVQHWHQVESDVKAVWNDIVGFVTGLPKRIIAALSRLEGDLKTWASDAWKVVKIEFSGAWDNEVAFWKAIPQKIIDAIKDFGAKLLQWGSDAWTLFKTFIEGAWDNEVAFWKGVPGKIINAVVGFGTMFVGWIKTAWSDFTQAINTAWSDTLGFFKSIPHLILDALKDAGTWLLGVGKDVIRGLANGLVSAAESLFGSIPFIGSKLVAMFKSALGVSSPSVIFHEIGRNLMEGLADGITDHAGMAVSALANVSGQLSGTSFGNFGGGYGASAGGSGTPMASVTTVVQLDGQTFLTAIQAAAVQWQRTSSQPFFGNVR